MTRDPREAEVARRLGGRYELLELLGRGGFASVYKIRNTRLDRVEALKVLAEGLTDDPDFARRFEQEARVAASLDHPHIVKVYDFSAAEGFFWFSMQLIDGPSVGRRLKTGGPLEEATAARIALGVLDALQYSHARGVIHRDIKPDNILLDPQGRPYLTDFGVAKSALALVKTHAGTLLGSPAYMSPEQLQGKPLDGRSDLYSVGITLYKALAGAFPFAADDTFRATMKRLSEPPEPLSARRPEVSQGLERIVMRALARRPEDRFATAQQMREAIEDFLYEVTPSRVRVVASAPVPDDATPTQVLVRPADAAAVPSPSPAGAGRPPAEVSSAPTGASSAATRPGRRARPWILATAILLALAAAASWLSNRSAPVRSLVPLASPTGATAAPTAAPAFALPAPVPTASHSPAPSPEPAATPTEAVVTLPEPTPARPAGRPTRAVRKRIVAPPARRRTPLSSPARPTARPTQAPPTPLPMRAAKVPPKLVSESPLNLPGEIRRAHANGTVGILVTVGVDGAVKNAIVISDLCPECDRAALEAVKRYRFQPALDADGKPIEARIAIALRF